MSLETVRRLAWTAIILFVMALVFAFNRGPILAWLAANHTPLLVGIFQAPLWLVAFLLIVLGLQCWLDIVEVDKTPFAIILHALGIMLCIGWWAALFSPACSHGSWTGVKRPARRLSRSCATRSRLSCSTMSRWMDTGRIAGRIDGRLAALVVVGAQIVHGVQ